VSPSSSRKVALCSWYATGYGELLGVVFGGPGLDGLDDAGTDPRAHLVSRIGQDPVRCAGPASLLRPGSFRNAEATLDVKLTEFRRLRHGGATRRQSSGSPPSSMS